MRILQLSLFVFVSVLFADSSAQFSTKTLHFPKPHDHTVLALDIMEKRDVMHLDYATAVFRKRCAACHGMQCRGDDAIPAISGKQLKGYDTIAQMAHAWHDGVHADAHIDLKHINVIEGIYASRYMHDRCIQP
jgi:cytochrome c1